MALPTSNMVAAPMPIFPEEIQEPAQIKPELEDQFNKSNELWTCNETTTSEESEESSLAEVDKSIAERKNAKIIRNIEIIIGRPTCELKNNYSTKVEGETRKIWIYLDDIVMIINNSATLAHEDEELEDTPGDEEFEELPELIKIWDVNENLGCNEYVEP